MQEKGLPKKLILQELNKKLQKDLTFTSGRILGSMCTNPHAFAKKIYSQNIEKNLGDPGLFPATAEIEKEAVQMIGSLLSNPNGSGYIVTGGTEANILALWTARNLANKQRNEVVLPKSAHSSFDKACDLLGLKPIKVGLNSRFQVDVDAVEKSITQKTVAIIGVAGTTSLGVVDPIPELSEIALKHDVYLHVDAAFGGFIIPFLKEIGIKTPDFDFRLPGVNSITIDPHKMGLAPIPAGGILFRNSAMANAIALKVPYLAGGETEQATVVGTRSGASAIAVWALLKHLGKEGYRRIVKRCMNLTWRLADGIRRVEGLSLITEPALNIVGIKSEEKSIQTIATRLRQKGWAISLFPTHIRVAVMPHVKPLHIEMFLNDIKEIMQNLA
ncbi:MAG: tyrosine decarboxylase MfnA [Candidatus Bathyarchaeia archaeon]